VEYSAPRILAKPPITGKASPARQMKPIPSSTRRSGPAGSEPGGDDSAAAAGVAGAAGAASLWLAGPLAPRFPQAMPAGVPCWVPSGVPGGSGSGSRAPGACPCCPRCSAVNPSTLSSEVVVGGAQAPAPDTGPGSTAIRRSMMDSVRQWQFAAGASISGVGADCGRLGGLHLMATWPGSWIDPTRPPNSGIVLVTMRALRR